VHSVALNNVQQYLTIIFKGRATIVNRVSRPASFERQIESAVCLRASQRIDCSITRFDCLLMPAGSAISALQFHAVRLACARHEQQLPDGSRAGFFLGDGEAHAFYLLVVCLLFDTYYSNVTGRSRQLTVLFSSISTGRLGSHGSSDLCWPSVAAEQAAGSRAGCL
jgi:hypothetical protein